MDSAKALVIECIGGHWKWELLNVTHLRTVAGFAQLRMGHSFQISVAVWREGQAGQGVDNQGINRIYCWGNQGGCCTGTNASALLMAMEMVCEGAHSQ